MRVLRALALTVLAACTRAPRASPVTEVEVAPEPIVEAPRVLGPVSATRFVSHMVNGQLFIEEIAVEPNAASANSALPTAAAAPLYDACDAACTALGAELVGSVVHRMVSVAHEVARACAPLDAGRLALARRLEARAAELAPTSRRSLLAAAVQLEPNARRLVLLATAADAENDGPAAIDAYRRAAALAHDDDVVERERAEAERRQRVEQRFDTIVQEHFTARFEGDAKKDLAWDALRVLDEAWRGVGDAIDVRPPAPITVVFYTGAAYQEATGARDWSGGQFDGKIRVRAGALKQGQAALRDLLFHEYLHAALATSVKGGVPAWFHEGLAQRLEPGLDRAHDLAPLKARKRADLPPLAELSRGFGRLTDHGQVRLYYACALDIVDELARWRGERSFAQLFAAMNSGKSFEAALDRVYGLDERLLQERWQSRY